MIMRKSFLTVPSLYYSQHQNGTSAIIPYANSTICGHVVSAMVARSLGAGSESQTSHGCS